MRCARDKTPAPIELQLAWQANAWHALPEAGGLLDQPAGLLNKMSATLNVYNATKAFRNSSGNLVHLANTQPETIALVRKIERLEDTL